VHSEPNGDYSANCYLAITNTPSSPDTVKFNDARCGYHSRSYYCQPMRGYYAFFNGEPVRKKVAPAPKKREGFAEKVFYINKMKNVPTNLNSRTPKIQRVVKTVTYSNSGRAWKGFKVSENFAVRWTGVIYLRKSGKYNWRIGSDDGSKLSLDRRLVVNNDGLHGFKTKAADKTVSNKVNLLLEFFERGGHAGMQFAYKGADTGNNHVWVGGCCSKVYPN